MTPLRNLVLVERIREEMSSGGIVLPQAFKRKHPTDKHRVQPDYWRGRVQAIGPEVRELAEGDEVLIVTWADEGHGGLYTGVDARTGGPATPFSPRVLVEYPEDIVCAVERGPEAA